MRNRISRKDWSQKCSILRNKHTALIPKQTQRAFMKLIFLLLTKHNFAALRYFTQSASHCVSIYIFTFHLLTLPFFTTWLSFIFYYIIYQSFIDWLFRILQLFNEFCDVWRLVGVIYFSYYIFLIFSSLNSGTVFRSPLRTIYQPYMSDACVDFPAVITQLILRTTVFSWCCNLKMTRIWAEIYNFYSYFYFYLLY